MRAYFNESKGFWGIFGRKGEQKNAQISPSTDLDVPIQPSGTTTEPVADNELILPTEDVLPTTPEEETDFLKLPEENDQVPNPTTVANATDQSPAIETPNTAMEVENSSRKLDAITPITQPAVLTPERKRGVTTDQAFLVDYYRENGQEVHPVATDSFLNKSRNEYNPAWLARELVQNFVDHNPQHPGTLDGVGFTEEDLEDGKKRFTITGNWAFGDPTGILSPHSEKRTDMNTAGGNGIGLKQTAIRYLRDFNVNRFEIQGENWDVNYRLAKAEEVNNGWQTNHPNQNQPYKLKHDWLIADIRESENTQKSVYVIETDNTDTIASVEQFPTLGVSTENPYLQDMSYQNKKGGIKWLPKGDLTEKPRGRLFINGQVMNFKQKGDSMQNYWVGPEFVTIQLNDVNYKMSIDRPPVATHELGTYLNEMTEQMSKEDLIDQLRQSEHIWAGAADSGYGSDRLGAYVVIEKIVSKLQWTSGYDKSEFSQLFSDKYLALDRKISEQQIGELEEKGYVLCPSYFTKIGMPEASSRLNPVEKASNETPAYSQYKVEQLAQESGIEVGTENFEDSSEEEFFQMVNARLRPLIEATTIDDEHHSCQIALNIDIPKELLFHRLDSPKNDQQRALHLLRSVAAYGLQKGIFKKFYSSQGEFITTYGTHYDSVTESHNLVIRNIKSSASGPSFIGVEFEKGFDQFKETLSNQAETENLTPEEEAIYLQIQNKKTEELSAEEQAIVAKKTKDKKRIRNNTG